MEDGIISFSKLRILQDHLTDLAEGAVLSLVEGRSKPGQGKKPDWLKKVLDFQITGINTGSTILELEAPEVESALKGRQYAIFDEPDIEDLLKESAFGLASYAYKTAVRNPENPDYWTNICFRNSVHLRKSLIRINRVYHWFQIAEAR